ncbi:MAG: SDR family NAD(P)-dependent oxidoreductase [Acidimicrobiales bacterium]
MNSPRALVTGASRGIGKATALALANAGFDVAVAARTLREGDGIDDADGVRRPIGGSVETTCALVEQAGRRALPVALDLLDLASLDRAVAAVEHAWGGVDVLVNNAVHTGEGSMTHVADLDVEMLRTKFEANVLAQVVLTQRVLPGMLARGHGVIVDITSAVAISDPAVPGGEGGWGFGYAMSKGAFHRLAGILAVELLGQGVTVFNVEPGFVMTERMESNAKDRGFEGRYQGAPPSVPAAVVAWLASDPEAAEFNGQTISAQRFALKRGLHADWRS